MENHRVTTNSDEPPPEFEFGSLTPTSPSQDSFSENSPADHLFFNGRLLPHAFPAASSIYTKRSISSTTSEYTSRCNSTNSSSSFGSNNSSTSQSPRTSYSTSNKNNSPINQEPLDLKLKPPISRCDKTVNTMSSSSYSSPQHKRRKAMEMATTSLYRSYSSQRWQYITPVPVRMSGGIRVGGRKKKAVRVRKKTEERRVSRVMKLWRKLLMAAIFVCRECHALEGA
ncbi:hypothetical protein AtNW77_Chr3g0171901 [Arabidopsis thaliana]|uniref:TPRXL n=4 Tax=Arabidopsis TaxID=3701 RepID=Q5BPR0_ARATH|nr:TPRXL [Arabidopsis thaliana]KAG7625313.1 hypothetical protein ISN45_At03g015580 [Arabidopsis thaliana x Arabidopsis arenosa]KAG7631320.1 hypothetical protein ISN44_As03g015620 [Arabidopsis suecica]AAX23843.1 hypothetical protein At3g15250 [Arabidopsis thaliana]AEE75635.1 TPRXL [Arabidopsis thaliana]OAP05681.1 hypothetical protein AXX17_AT3G15900 [Arabidopsis thaliana]|eukprot:NP_188143.2 TPRXL [Arabidopsis thaliana]